MLNLFHQINPCINFILSYTMRMWAKLQQLIYKYCLFGFYSLFEICACLLLFYFIIFNATRHLGNIPRIIKYVATVRSDISYIYLDINSQKFQCTLLSSQYWSCCKRLRPNSYSNQFKNEAQHLYKNYENNIWRQYWTKYYWFPIYKLINLTNESV